MRYIAKSQTPHVLARYKGRSFAKMRRKVKDPLKAALTWEQGGLCCYCESDLEFADSHIEHLEPQSTHPHRDLDYDNMLCSCMKDLEANGDPKRCGHLKANGLLPVTPLDPSCEARFRFGLDGHIEPASPADLDAAETINMLGLNTPKMRDLRVKVLSVFDDLTPNQAATFAARYLTRSDAGCLRPYWTTIKQLFAS